MMKYIYIIGAGQLGSRHLQALKAVEIPLDIKVIDPCKKSLRVAEERYKATAGTSQLIEFSTDICKNDKEVDLAIVATNSDVRRRVIENLLSVSKVKYFILEKLLFQKKQDYQAISRKLLEHKSKAWVNCSMRTMPFYFNLKKEVEPVFTYLVTGSHYGLVTNAVHYIDHMAFLSNCLDYKVDTSRLDPELIKSKRKGFWELNGQLRLSFRNGSQGIFACFPKGSAPICVEIHSGNFRCISKESEQKAWICSRKDNWRWQEVEAKIPFQSERTTKLVEDILRYGKCLLPSYDEAAKLHLTYLESLKNFLNKNYQKKIDYYPFT